MLKNMLKNTKKYYNIILKNYIRRKAEKFV